ncbi:DUF3127 domain-containing protein [Segatella albensis]|jgi:hypothetical protein|uniref:DUF3127 domain-containing protein n=1 Tax=Segatella albensis TaxID=77768 RepID=UPI00040CF1A7|nr:DUF3127 domain-containing protein [Segatella albensis]
MEIQGKIIAVLPLQSGVSQRTGNKWASQDYVIETHDQYPRKCCFRVFGEEKINNFNIQSGEELSVSFDIDCHEYNGRWFNDIRAWAVNRVDPAAAMAAPGAQPMGANVAPAPVGGAAAPFPPAPEGNAEGASDDLPF